MVVVVVELVRAIVHDIELLFYPHEQFLVPVNKFFNDHRFFNCQIVNCHDLAKYENQTNNGTTPKPQEAIREGLPVAASTMYMGFFGFVFSVAALLHFQEFFCLAQFIWYLLGLPGGYLILLIYSAANLNSRSWGTREVKSDKDKENIFTILYSSLKRTISACFQGRTKPEPSQDNESKQVDEEESDEKEPEEEQGIAHKKLLNVNHTFCFLLSSCLGACRNHSSLAVWLVTRSQLLCELHMVFLLC